MLNCQPKSSFRSNTAAAGAQDQPRLAQRYFKEATTLCERDTGHRAFRVSRTAPSHGAGCGGSAASCTCFRRTMPMYASKTCFTGCFIVFSPMELVSMADVGDGSTSISIRSKGASAVCFLARPTTNGATRLTKGLPPTPASRPGPIPPRMPTVPQHQHSQRRIAAVLRRIVLHPTRFPALSHRHSAPTRPAREGAGLGVPPCRRNRATYDI
jgi:hypothetical protein